MWNVIASLKSRFEPDPCMPFVKFCLMEMGVTAVPYRDFKKNIGKQCAFLRRQTGAFGALTQGRKCFERPVGGLVLWWNLVSEVGSSLQHVMM